VGLENHLAITTSAGHLQPAAGIALAVARPRHSLRRKSAHRIEDIHYGPDAGPSWSACTCGESFDAESPDALAALWIAHKKDGLT
jgi:hypothetical protein